MGPLARCRAATWLREQTLLCGEGGCGRPVDSPGMRSLWAKVCSCLPAAAPSPQFLPALPCPAGWDHSTPAWYLGIQASCS